MDAAAVTAAMSPRTVAVIAVHQYGLPAPLDAIRAAVGPDVRVVEDCAQLWDDDLRSTYEVGRHSDVVVSSFGPRKPFTLGWGGAACADTSSVRNVLGVGVSARDLRARSRPVAPFAIPAPSVRRLRDAASLATRSLTLRRRFVAAVQPLLTAAGMRVLGPADPGAASWHRLPVLVPEDLVRMRARAVAAAARYGLAAQEPHPETVTELPLFRHAPRRFSSEFTGIRNRLMFLRPPGTGAAALPAVRQWMDHLREVR
jgi:hypothetical protein